MLVRGKGRNYLEILLVVLLASGLIYAFCNVLNGKIQGQENQKDMKQAGNVILKSVKQADRMECKTSVYLDLGEEVLQDTTKDMNIVHDFLHQRIQIGRRTSTEIFEYGDGIPNIYSKGISPVYNKADAMMRKVARDQWYQYSSEKMYGKQWEKGECDQLSYGYLTDEKYFWKIEKHSKVTVGEETYTKYKAVIRNTLRNKNRGEESDNEFRKTLSANGLNVMTLKKGYPEVYKKLRDRYNQETEEMYIWIDKDGNMVRIDKDHTFLYYMEIMKENSEKIEEKAGQYGYPNAYCRQDYVYNPSCKVIEMPKDYNVL